MSDKVQMDEAALLGLTTDIVAAFLSHNSMAPDAVPTFFKTIREGIESSGAPAPEPDAPAQEPAVAIRASVKPDYIVCLEDGKKLKMLKRYLRTNYNMTPEEYLAKWKLPRDYPMVAPNYAETRRKLAKQIGLGTASNRSAKEPGLPLS